VSVSALAGIADGDEPRGTRHDGTVVDPHHYRVEQNLPCFEPDVFNLTNEHQVYAFQLLLGSEYSEVQVQEVAPGEFAHLHLFTDVWTQGPQRERLIDKAEDTECTLLVFDTRSPSPSQ